jgi:hypothetical protein
VEEDSSPLALNTRGVDPESRLERPESERPCGTRIRFSRRLKSIQDISGCHGIRCSGIFDLASNHAMELGP